MPKLTVFPLFTGFNLSPRQFDALETLAQTTKQTKAAVLRRYLEQEADQLELPREAVRPQSREGVHAWRHRRARGGEANSNNAA
jgi:hypothetical protein